MSGKQGKRLSGEPVLLALRLVLLLLPPGTMFFLLIRTGITLLHLTARG